MKESYKDRDHYRDAWCQADLEYILEGYVDDTDNVRTTYDVLLRQDQIRFILKNIKNVQLYDSYVLVKK